MPSWTWQCSFHMFTKAKHHTPRTLIHNIKTCGQPYQCDQTNNRNDWKVYILGGCVIATALTTKQVVNFLTSIVKHLIQIWRPFVITLPKTWKLNHALLRTDYAYALSSVLSCFNSCWYSVSASFKSSIPVPSMAEILTLEILPYSSRSTPGGIPTRSIWLSTRI